MDAMQGELVGITDTPTWAGFVAAGVAILLFGSNFVPVKKFETGDGLFFQWMMCSAIWVIGLCVHAIQGFPTFYPLAMLGGFLWATGNIMVVPILKTIGLAQGLLIWATVNLVTGWATGRFGMFGLDPEIPPHQTMNYIGVALCVVSAVFFVFVKSDIPASVEDTAHEGFLQSDLGQYDDDDDPLIGNSHSGLINPNERVTISPEASMGFIDNLSLFRKRGLGFLMSAIAGVFFGSSFAPVIYVQDNYHGASQNGIIFAVVSGVLYGVNFTPVIYIQDNVDNASQNGLDYVFAHFCGIYVTSTVYFLIYCGAMANNPRVYPRAILPAFISGGLWAIADASWFIANSALSEAVSFPIITAGPGIIAALWGIFAFREIKGWRNYAILLAAFSVTITGTVLTGLSKLD